MFHPHANLVNAAIMAHLSISHKGTPGFQVLGRLHHLVPPQVDPLPIFQGYLIAGLYLIRVVVALLANHAVHGTPKSLKGS